MTLFQKLTLAALSVLPMAHAMADLRVKSKMNFAACRFRNSSTSHHLLEGAHP